MLLFSQILIEDLNRFQGGAGDILARYLEHKPEIAESLDSLQLTPDLTVALALDEESIEWKSLPTMAPALWAKDRRPGETPPDFIQRHYGPWIGKGLTRPYLSQLDKSLCIQLGRWLERTGSELPFDLPGKHELMRREATPDKPEELKEALRVASRLYVR